MKAFLRLETNSNILGSTDKNVTFISISEITSIRSDSNGGSIVLYGTNNEISVPDLSPDHLMTKCVYSLLPSELSIE